MRYPIDPPINITTGFGVPDSNSKFGYHTLGRLWYTIFMKEQWKDVDGYLGLYQISDRGNLRRMPVVGRNRNTKNISYPKGSLNAKGYLTYKLYSLNGTKKTYSAHRLVAKAFLSNPLGLPQVNHKDGVKINNHISNLEWCTNTFNMAHAVENNLINNRGEKSGQNKFTENLIRQVLESSKGKRYKVLSAETGISVGYIKAIRCGKRWNHLWKEYNA